MPSLDLDKLSDFVEEWWDKSALPSLCEFVEIPALSPSFDSDWEANGYLDAAVNTFVAWTRSLPLKGLSVSVHRLKNRSPLLLVKIDGDEDGEVLFYSHLDKQPEASGWSEGKGPWKPVIEDGWLFGRGSVDDGYGGYAGILSVLALQDQGISHPTCRFLIETGEESGSPDLSYYLGSRDSNGKIMESSEDLCLYILNETGVVTVAGKSFGVDNNIRISYATSEDIIKKAIQLMNETLSK